MLLNTKDNFSIIMEACAARVLEIAATCNLSEDETQDLALGVIELLYKCEEDEAILIINATPVRNKRGANIVPMKVQSKRKDCNPSSYINLSSCADDMLSLLLNAASYM